MVRFYRRLPPERCYKIRKLKYMACKFSVSNSVQFYGLFGLKFQSLMKADFLFACDVILQQVHGGVVQVDVCVCFF
jgi:hypothetical protein